MKEYRSWKTFDKDLDKSVQCNLRYELCKKIYLKTKLWLPVEPQAQTFSKLAFLGKFGIKKGL